MVSLDRAILTVLLSASLAIAGFSQQANSAMTPESIDKLIKDTLAKDQTPPLVRGAATDSDPCSGVSIVWREYGSCFDSFLKDGSKVFVIKDDRVNIAVAGWQAGMTRIDLDIKNIGSQRFDIDPNNVTLLEFGKKSKQVQRLDADQLARSQGTNARIGAIVAGAFGDRSYDKTSENLKAQGNAAWIAGTALRLNTIMPGEEKTGVVWFNKGGPELQLSVNIAGRIYVFPFAIRKGF